MWFSIDDWISESKMISLSLSLSLFSFVSMTLTLLCRVFRFFKPGNQHSSAAVIFHSKSVMMMMMMMILLMKKKKKKKKKKWEKNSQLDYVFLLSRESLFLLSVTLSLTSWAPRLCVCYCWGCTQARFPSCESRNLSRNISKSSEFYQLLHIVATNLPNKEREREIELEEKQKKSL